MGETPETRVAGRYHGRGPLGTILSCRSTVAIGRLVRRSYAARCEAGTCSTHAAAGKPAGLSHLDALLSNSSPASRLPATLSINCARLSARKDPCSTRPRICAAATSARYSEFSRASRSPNRRAPKKAATVSARSSATVAICRGRMLDLPSGPRPVENGTILPPPPSPGEGRSWDVAGQLACHLHQRRLHVPGDRRLRPRDRGVPRTRRGRRARRLDRLVPPGPPVHRNQAITAIVLAERLRRLQRR